MFLKIFRSGWENPSLFGSFHTHSFCHSSLTDICYYPPPSIKVSNPNFLQENRAIIAQKISYVLSKNCTKFRYKIVLMRKTNFKQIMKKILVFAHFVIPAISLFRAILLNFEEQLQEINESKINPIRALLYSARSHLHH